MALYFLARSFDLKSKPDFAHRTRYAETVRPKNSNGIRNFDDRTTPKIANNRFALHIHEKVSRSAKEFALRVRADFAQGAIRKTQTILILHRRRKTNRLQGVALVIALIGEKVAGKDFQIGRETDRPKRFAIAEFDGSKCRPIPLRGEVNHFNGASALERNIKI
jgi:hypothetical protein